MIFHENFHPTTVSESDSESVSESKLFFRIRIHNTASDLILLLNFYLDSSCIGNVKKQAHSAILSEHQRYR
jgi:hypothetical protein